jgi:branched-chain amino acid transport system ATP-binding protein
VRGHGGALLGDEGPNVDGGGDQRFRDPEFVGLVDGFGGIALGRQVGPLGYEPLDVVTIHRGLEDPGCRSQLAGPHADAVHLHVIRVTVGAALVVDRQDVGPFVEEHARETTRSLVDIGAREALGRVVRRFASHARVVVPEELDAVDAEYPSRVHRFFDAAIGKCLARREPVAWCFAEFASRRDDENDTMSLGFRARHRPAGRDRFVVGMGVERNQRLWSGARHRRRPPQGEFATPHTVPRPMIRLIDFDNETTYLILCIVVLEAVGVTKRFAGIMALSDVSLDVAEGERVGLIGPNGAGKTTLFNCLLGLLRPDHGRVTFDGRDLTRVATHKRARLGIGRTFQRIELFAGMTPREHFLVAGRAHSGKGGVFRDALYLGRPTADEQARAGAMLELLGLGAVGDRKVEALSLGVGRLIEVGRALMTEPRLLLLDEPSSGLDREETTTLAETLTKVHHERGTAILLVEHDVDLVRSFVTRVFVLDFGTLIAAGPTAQVFADDAVRKAYLGDMV